MLIDCSQLSKTYYNVLFGSFTRDRHAWRIYLRTFSADEKPVTRQNISSCSVLSPKIVMHDEAYIGGRWENNIKCVVHDDLGWKNQTTRYILPRYWLYEWFSQFHRCGTYLVLSRNPSIVSWVSQVASNQSWQVIEFFVYDDLHGETGCCRIALLLLQHPVSPWRSS